MGQIKSKGTLWESHVCCDATRQRGARRRCFRTAKPRSFHFHCCCYWFFYVSYYLCFLLINLNHYTMEPSLLLPICLHLLNVGEYNCWLDIVCPQGLWPLPEAAFPVDISTTYWLTLDLAHWGPLLQVRGWGKQVSHPGAWLEAHIHFGHFLPH